MNNCDNTYKFKNKADFYENSRPSYPKEILTIFQKFGVNTDTLIADLGAGTGKFTRVIADLNCNIFAIEPNLDMFNMGKKMCSELKNVKFINAKAENTTILDGSIDYITIAQAFHWLDKEKCETEFKRILKPHGKVMIVYNSKIVDDEFTKAYENHLKSFNNSKENDDYLCKKNSSLNFLSKNIEINQYSNKQILNCAGLLGRALSLSYTPLEGNTRYEEFIDGIKEIFAKYNLNDNVELFYKTEIFVGEL